MSKESVKRIVRSVETIGTPTLKSLYEFVLLSDYTGGNTPDLMTKMLQEIGKQIRKERYDREVLLSAFCKLQRENDRLRQLELFKTSSTIPL